MQAVCSLLHRYDKDEFHGDDRRSRSCHEMCRPHVRKHLVDECGILIRLPCTTFVKSFGLAHYSVAHDLRPISLPRSAGSLHPFRESHP